MRRTFLHRGHPLRHEIVRVDPARVDARPRERRCTRLPRSVVGNSHRGFRGSCAVRTAGRERANASTASGLRAPEYDEASGLRCFLSVDPVIAKAAVQNPQLWNRYAYVGNNPMNRTDPDGRLIQFRDGDYTREVAFSEFQKLFTKDAQKYISRWTRTATLS